ncbi:MAG: FecR domain-containing protein, partial [Planctomycetes bacterium]|nr:FecR domain-containing protein [Planctomycetota bacterium]
RVSVPVGAHLAIAFAGGRCEIGSASEAVVEATDRVHGRVVLASGSMSADVAGGDLFAVRTPDATIRLSDAAATIGVAARRTQVVVMRGAVEVATLDGAARTIGAGGSWTSATLTEVATR